MAQTVNTQQLDLFAWADSRPSAKVYRFRHYLGLAILADPDRYDIDITPLPPIEECGHVIPMRLKREVA